jgi:acylphosphatase
MERKQARRWIIRGNVQGVGFRAFTEHKAHSLGLSGWVRNCDDGSVEAYAVGSKAELDDFAAFLHTGPRSAQVRGVDEREEAVQKLAGFSMR